MNQNGTSSFELVVESGSQSGQRFAVNRPLISIGRSADNDIVLQDPMVSKNHARVIQQGNNLLVEDLGSSNGTIVNGQKVTSHVLADGDRLYLGETNLTFRAAVPATVTTPMAAAGAVPVAPAVAMPPVAEAKAKGGKKGLWIALAAVAGLAVLAGVAVLLVVLLTGESDAVKPEAKFTSPSAGTQVQLGLPAGTPKEVEIKVTASDNKGLDRVELSVNDQLVKTMKATTSTRESKSSGNLKEEEFTYKWSSSSPGNYSFKAEVYDWKGNTAEADPVAVSVVNGPEIEQAHAYCQQIDGMITEFVQFRKKLNDAYQAAKAGRVSYVEAGYVFDQVGNERRALKGRLASTPPPGPFGPSHALFDKQIDYAIQADNYAVLWARDMQVNMPYYESGYIANPDPNNYEGLMQNASSATQQAGKAFGQEYNAERAAQLKIGPGPDPNG
jgi:pSer/pThr/pTyr-binding forkhead associated (FHA) protein